MWRRSWRWLLVVGVGVMLAGCGAEMKWELTPEMAETEPAPAESELSYRTAMLVDELDTAVRMIADRQYEAAGGKLEPLEPQFLVQGDRARAAEALFWYGYCREKLNRPDEARLAYERVGKEYGDQPSARHARRRLDQLKLES